MQIARDRKTGDNEKLTPSPRKLYIVSLFSAYPVLSSAMVSTLNHPARFLAIMEWQVRSRPAL